MASGTITQPNKTVTFTPTLTKSSGSSSVASITGSRSGNVVTLTILFTNGTQPSAGNNSFIGTLSNCPLPGAQASGIGYYSASLFAVNITSAGALTERVLLSSGYWGSSDAHGVTITYVCA